MFKQLIEWLQKGQASGLEAYIVSRNPQNAAEVDYWQRQYELNNSAKRF